MTDTLQPAPTIGANGSAVNLITTAERFREQGRCLRLAFSPWATKQMLLTTVTTIALCVVNARSVGAGAAVAAEQGNRSTAEMLSDPGILMLIWTKGAVLGMLVMMALAITRPHETGIHHAEAIAVPRRWQWPLSRWIAGALILGLSTLAMGTAVWLVAGSVGAPGPFTLAEVAPRAARLALGMVALSALVAGVACLVRNSAALGILLGLWYLLGEEVLGLVDALHPATRFLPLANLWHAAGFTRAGTPEPPWSSTMSLLYLALLGAILLAVGLRRSARR